MIIVKLTGGLGNQMFQYAFGRSIAIKNNQKLYLDTGYYKAAKASDGERREFELKVFNIKARIASPYQLRYFRIMAGISAYMRKLGVNPGFTYVHDNFYSANYHPMDISDIVFPAYLDGYWSVASYFDGMRKELNAEFQAITPLDEKNSRLASRMKEDASVALHIRRGDYLEVGSMNTGNESYYSQAISNINNTVRNPVYYIFSNDTTWVRQEFIKNLSGHRFEIIDHNHGKDSWKDLELMRRCKHNIIANSTFSWWAAWLNDNPDKLVIAPKRWLVDKHINDRSVPYLLPASWISI